MDNYTNWPQGQGAFSNPVEKAKACDDDKHFKFVAMVAALSLPGAVLCQECSGELQEFRNRFKCSDCGTEYLLSKIDELRFDDALDSNQALKSLILEARDLVKKEAES